MAETLPRSGVYSVPTADGNAGADGKQCCCWRVTANGEQTESSANDKVWKQLKSLNDIVFYIELMEYLGNCIGTVAMIWATVVLLGGFCSYLTGMDFWFATVMVFLESTRVFISKDTSVNQWLFGSTRAFRWDHFCFSDMHDYGTLIAVIIGAGISLAPVEFGSQIIFAGMLKVAILAITCLLLTRRRWNYFDKAVIALFLLAGVCGSFYGFAKIMAPHKSASTRAKRHALAKVFGLFSLWYFGTKTGTVVTNVIMSRLPEDFSEKTKQVFWLKVIVASLVVCLPVLQAILGSKYRWLSISIAAVLLPVNVPEAAWCCFPLATSAKENNLRSNALLLGTWDLLSKIVDTIMPILFFWGVMFPLPGISLTVSFYMLFSVIAAVLVGNLQIPVAFLQILLSSLRLHSLLAGHHHPHHRDYHPLPQGASPNLVPSIVVFFVLELCQGSSNILGVILGLISFRCRRSLVHALGVTEEEWGAKAVNLYYHQACMTIKEKGLFPLEKSTPPSFDSFAVESLGCTSSEMQIVRLRVLDYYLRPQADSKTKSKLMAQIAKDSAGIVIKIAGTISHLITNDSVIPHLADEEDKVQEKKQIRSSLSLSLNVVWRLAIAGGTRFRQEMSGNPIVIHSLQRILEDLESYHRELWEPAMEVIKLLALHDEATAKKIGSIDAVIPKLMGVFLDRVRVINNDDRKDGRSRAAGEVLANLTITSSDNCRTILDLEEAGSHHLIENLISKLQDEEYMSVAANLLHNLCANSEDMLIDLGAKEGLKSALRMVMQLIIGNANDKQLDAALCVASEIGYLISNKEDFACVLPKIPKEDFARVLPITDTGAEELVGKLVDTLKSNREPNREFPRLRRVLIGTVICIVESCPAYIELFREKGAEDALKMLKGTSSRLEKYKVFVEGEGMVPESTPMHKVVDKAIGLIIRV